MLKTERMRWIVVAGAKPQLVSVIQTLQRLKALHIREHTPDEFFGYGNPLPEGEEVAEARIKARGLEKSLGLDEAPPAPAKHAPADWAEAIATVRAVERAVTDILSSRDDVLAQLKEQEAAAARLRRLAPLGLRLEEFSGYRNLRLLLGTTSQDPTARLREKLGEHHLILRGDGNEYLVALFVRNAESEKAESILTEHGFHALEPPTGEGSMDARIGFHVANARRLRARLDELELAIRSARAEHGPGLLAASGTLASAAERANAPLRFATSRHGFVVTGYVPARRLAEVEKELQAATGHGLYIETHAPPKTTPGHGHAQAHAHEEETAAAAPREDPPIRFTHGQRGVAAFTQMLRMHSLPKYREIDPTVLMFITFPLFFAVMIGDLAFGILIMLVAAYLFRHSIFGIGGPRVARMLMLAGFWTAVFGVFVYGEAFGIHFVEEPGHLSWEWIFGMDWHNYYVGHGHTHHLGFHVGEYTIQLGYLSKLVDVLPLLAISAGIAILHLNLALLIGIRNQWVLHGPKHAILARFSWLVMEAGIVLLAWGGIHDEVNLMRLGGAVLAVAVVMIIAGEGVVGALELPKLVSNGASYFRLAAVAMSKAGMALAVNTFAFVAITETNYAVAGIGGWVLLIIGHTVILALGIIAGGLHAMRLQLVEFFGWFFEGGGRPFQAFGDPQHRP